MKIVPILIAMLTLMSSTESQFCPRRLMESYFLEGLLLPDETPVPFCPSIKSNCCTPEDMINVYNKFENELKPKLEETHEKYLRSIKRLSLMHQRVMKLKDRKYSDPKQEGFCKKKLKEVKKFKMISMTDSLRLFYKPSFKYRSKIHKSLICLFCDYNALKEFNLPTKSIPVETKLCHFTLLENKEYLTQHSVLLVEYFMKMQEALDCLLDEKKFGEPFVFGYEQKLRLDFMGCFNELTPDEMNETCQDLCKLITVGSISPVFDGDYWFVERAVSFMNSQIETIIYKRKNTPPNLIEKLKEFNNNDVVKFFNVTSKRKQFTSKFNNPSRFIGFHDEEVATKNPTDINCNFTAFLLDLEKKANNLQTRVKHESATYSNWYANFYIPLCTVKTANDTTEPADGRFRLGDRNYVNDERLYTSSDLDLVKVAKVMTNTTELGLDSLGGNDTEAAPKRRLGGSGKKQKGTAKKTAQRVSKTKGKANQKEVLVKKSKVDKKNLKTNKKTKMNKKSVSKKSKKDKHERKLKPKTRVSKNLLHSAKKASKKNKRKTQKSRKNGKQMKKKPQRHLEDSGVKNEKLIDKIAEAVEEKIESKVKLMKRKQTLRVLEELRKEDEMLGGHITGGRVLQEEFVDPRLKENPEEYYKMLFDSITFLLNSTSSQIHPNLANFPVISEFQIAPAKGQGLDAQDYLATMNFEMTVTELRKTITDGASAEDNLDWEVSRIVTMCSDKMMDRVVLNLDNDYSASISKEFLSKDDNDAAGKTGFYDKAENFEIGSRFFSSRVKDQLEFVVNNSFLFQSKISKSKTPMPKSYFTEGPTEDKDTSTKSKKDNRKQIL
jgi:hypothetical protein